MQAVTAVNLEFGAEQRLSAMWVWSWDSAHRAVITFMLPWQLHVM